MGGINRIQAKREEIRQPQQSDMAPAREIWFKDGDQAFVTPIASGEDGDNLLDEIYLYTYKSGNRWINLLSDDSVDTSVVPDTYRPAHKFAFWGYVHEVIHPDKRNDDWIEVNGPGGKKMYKEEVNDFRVIALSFGRSDYIWNQLVDVYNDWGKLNGGVVRVKRTGAGMYDTSYQIAPTARDSEMPDDRQSDIEELPPIKEYYLGRYGGGNMPASNNVVSTTETSKNLF
jgi:hypothetical protein